MVKPLESKPSQSVWKYFLFVPSTLFAGVILAILIAIFFDWYEQTNSHHVPDYAAISTMMIAIPVWTVLTAITVVFVLFLFFRKQNLKWKLQALLGNVFILLLPYFYLFGLETVSRVKIERITSHYRTSIKIDNLTYHLEDTNNNGLPDTLVAETTITSTNKEPFTNTKIQGYTDCGVLPRVGNLGTTGNAVSLWVDNEHVVYPGTRTYLTKLPFYEAKDSNLELYTFPDPKYLEITIGAPEADGVIATKKIPIAVDYQSVERIESGGSNCYLKL